MILVHKVVEKKLIVLKKNKSNMCKDVIETKGVQLQVEMNYMKIYNCKVSFDTGLGCFVQ